jgi:hypothetical protein
MGSVPQMLLHAIETSSSLSNPCQRKQRLLSLLVAGSLQFSLSRNDDSLREVVVEHLTSEFGWDPMVQIALGDVATHGVGVGVPVVLRDIVSPPKLISSGGRLSLGDIQVAVGHYTSAIAVITNGSFVSLLSSRQPQHPLGLQGLHWNLCGCSPCHSDCSWLDTQPPGNVSYPVALKMGAAFRLAWFLVEKGTTVAALQAFERVGSMFREFPVDDYSRIAVNLLEIGRSAVSQQVQGIADAIADISLRLDGACSSHHPLRSTVDVCDAFVYQQLAVMLHKRVCILSSVGTCSV